jgi:hypothetical protein
VPIPYDHLVGAPGVESLYGGIGLAGKKRSQLGTFWIRLILSANPGDPLGIGHNKNRFPRLGYGRHRADEYKEKFVHWNSLSKSLSS